MKNEGIPVLIIDGYDSFKDGEADDLWKQGVNLDDWDYCVVAPVETLNIVERESKDWETNQPVIYHRHVQKKENLDRLLSGCSHNYWYIVFFRGVKVAMGVAYHS